MKLQIIFFFTMVIMTSSIFSTIIKNILSEGVVAYSNTETFTTAMHNNKFNIYLAVTTIDNKTLLLNNPKDYFQLFEHLYNEQEIETPK